MASLDDFFPNVTLEVPECPLVLIRHQIRNAAIEFCEKTLAWQYDCAAVNAVAGQASYTLSIPAGTDIHNISSVRHNNWPLTAVTSEWMNDNYTAWESETGVQASSVIYIPPLTIKLYPFPNTTGTGTIKVRVTLKPSRTALTLDDNLYNRYVESIAAGAKYRLMAQPKKAWTDPEMSMYYRGIFSKGINSARADFITNYSDFHGNIHRRLLGH